MPGIGIITNPHSKLNKRNPGRSELLGYILGKKGIIETTHSLEHLASVAREFRAQEIEVLAINGGDGTISRTLSAFVEAYGDEPLPKVAVLRGGTMNVLAGHLGIRSTPEETLYSLLQHESHGESWPTKEVSLLKVGQHVGFIYADGANARLLAEYYKDKNGIPGAIWLMLRLIGSFLLRGELYRRLYTPERTTFEAKPQPPRDYNAIGTFASTISTLPLGLPLLRGASKDPDKFQAICVDAPLDTLLWYLPALMLTQREGPTWGKSKYFCHELVITRYDDHFSYTLDGELYETKGSLQIQLAQKVSFICL